MMGSCYVCSASITPGDGPGLLAAADAEAPVRQAFHLACWLTWRAVPASARPPLPAPALRVAA